MELDNPNGFASGTYSSASAKPASLALTRFETPLGSMVAGDWLGNLCLLEFADNPALERKIADLERILGTVSHPGRTDLHSETECQIAGYFKGQLASFTIPLETPGSVFRKSVWGVLLAIPYGETRSYKEQAVALGRPEAVRAVANADGQNRISIVIPCHRVIGSDLRLTGYSGGLDRKAALLELETRHKSNLASRTRPFPEPAIRGL